MDKTTKSGKSCQYLGQLFLFFLKLLLKTVKFVNIYYLLMALHFVLSKLHQ